MIGRIMKKYTNEFSDQLEKVVQTETRIMKPLDNSSPALGLAEDNLIQEEVTRNMLDPRVPHVRS